MALPALFLVGVVVVLVALLARLARSAPRPVCPPSPELREAERTTGRWRGAGAAAGLVVGTVAAYQGGLGRGLMLAAPLFALCVLAGVIVGELRVSAPRGPVRTAGLEVRRVRDYLPRVLGSAVGAALVLLSVVLTVTTAAGSPDDLGRAGRNLFRRCSATSGQGHGPWPGSYYTVPLMIVVVCGLLAAGLAVTRVVRRPRPSGDTVVDDHLRRSAAGSVTAAIGLLVTVPLGGVSAVAAGGLVGIDCRPGWWNVAAIALVVLTVAALALAACCTAALAWPRGGARADRPAEPAVR